MQTTVRLTSANVLPEVIILGETNKMVVIKSTQTSANVNKAMKLQYIGGTPASGNLNANVSTVHSLQEPSKTFDYSNASKNIAVVSQDGSQLGEGEFVNFVIEYELISIV